MPPRRPAPNPSHTPTPPTSTPPTQASSAATSTSTPTPSSSLTQRSSPQEIAQHVWSHYLHDTPPRMLLLDAFMAFLVLVGVIQFVYCVLVGNYPFNAFLSGFSAAVGQFVLTASLRMQMHDSASSSSSTASRSKQATTKEKEVLDGKEQGGAVSSERAFADYVFGSLILHFFCVNFIN